MQIGLLRTHIPAETISENSSILKGIVEEILRLKDRAAVLVCTDGTIFFSNRRILIFSRVRDYGNTAY